MIKRLVLIGAIFVTGVMATTYNNPGSGGVADGYLRKNERAVNGYIADGGSSHSSQAGANLDSLFVTWDDDYIYIFLSTNNTENWDVAYGIGIDDRGRSTGYTGGSSPNDGWNRKIGFDNGYNVEYELYFWWENDNSQITSAQLCSWDGSAWSCEDLTNGTDFSYQGGSSGLQSLEIKIAKSRLNNPGTIAVSAWVCGGEGSSAVDAIPDESDVADDDWGDVDSVSQMYEHTISTGRTPNWFMILDGTLSRDGYQTNELFYTTSDKQAYVTWDADSIYVGYIFQDLSGDYDLCIYFDTDPQKNKNFGKGVDIDASVSITLPFNADYGIHIIDGTKSLELKRFDESSGNWENVTFNGQYYAGYSANGTSEISIPWSDIGTPDSFYMVVYLLNTSDSKAYGIAPSDGNTDGTDNITNFIGFFRSSDEFAPSEHIGDTNHIMEIYSSSETGNGTLRNAMEIANGDVAQDTIIFRVNATITLNTDLPRIVNPLYISGGNSSVTIDGNSKAHDGFRISTDSTFTPISYVGIYNITVQNAISAVRISVGNGSPISDVQLISLYVSSCKNGVYTGLVGDNGTNGGAYDNVKIEVDQAYIENVEDYGIYLRTTQSGKKVRAEISGSYIETCGDETDEAGLAALDNVSLWVYDTEFRGNYFGILLWNTSYAEAQYDTISSSKIDSSFYSGVVVKREAGNITAIFQSDSIFTNGGFGTEDAGIVVSAFSDNSSTADIQIYSSKIFGNSTDQEYGILVADWSSAGDNGKDIKIGDTSQGNEIHTNTTHGIYVSTDRAKGLNVLYNYIHDNGQHGISIAYADSVLIEGDTIKNHSDASDYGVAIDGVTKSGSDYNKITHSIFENNSYGIKLLNGANSGIAQVQISQAALDTAMDVLTVTGNYAPTNGTVEVYIADGRNGKKYLAEGTAEADGSWAVTVSNASSNGITEGTPITAIAIDEHGNTCEFAAPVGAVGIEEGSPDTGGNGLEVNISSVTTSSMHISLSAPTLKEVSVQLLDVTGRIVKENKLPLTRGRLDAEIPIPSSGVYFVRIIHNGKVMWSKRIVSVR